MATQKRDVGVAAFLNISMTNEKDFDDTVHHTANHMKRWTECRREFLRTAQVPGALVLRLRKGSPALSYYHPET